MAAPQVTPPPRLQRRSGSETVLPLTTIFTPPRSCLDAPFTLSTSSSGNVGFSSAWRDYYEESSECYPYSFSSLQYTWNWYSPGVCPSGYNIAQTSKLTGSVDTTQAWCCPSSLTIAGWMSGGASYQGCTSLASNTAVITVENGLATTITPSFSFVAVQWPVSVEWASTDLARFHPASAPLIEAETTSTISSFSGTAATGGARQTGRVSSTGTAAASTSNGLSTGATAGIAVGVAIAGILILVGIIFWVLKRRRGRQMIPEGPDNVVRPYYIDGKVEFSSEESQSRQLRPIELDALGNSHELGGNEGDIEHYKTRASPIELEGNWQGHEKPANSINSRT